MLLLLIIVGAVIILALLSSKWAGIRTRKILREERTVSLYSSRHQRIGELPSIQSIEANKNPAEKLFSLPVGRFLPWLESVQDPVEGGFLTEDEWKEFSSHYDKKRLDPEKRQKVECWHNKKLEAYDYNEKRYKDLAKVRKYIKDSTKFNDKRLVKPVYKDELAINRYSNRGLCWYDKKSFWGAQCLVLSAIPWIKHDFSCFAFKRNAESVIGCHPDKLYPLISSNTDAYFLYSLIYDFGYGPNKFPWHDQRMDEETLMGKPTKLYLVEINLGALYGKNDFNVVKVGITTKGGIVGPGDNFRFSGKYQNHVNLLKCVKYEDGRVAYMKEQTILKLASEQDRRSTREMPFCPESIPNADRNVLGTTEWIFVGSPTKKAVTLFTQVAGTDFNN